MGEVETEQGRGKHVSGTEERMLGVQSAPYRHEVEVRGKWGAGGVGVCKGGIRRNEAEQVRTREGEVKSAL